MEGLAKLAFTVLILLAIWFIGGMVYNVTVHPLSRFPGPKIAGATRLYECYFDCFSWPGGQYVFKIDELHEKYGPIVRISPRELHIKDPDFHEVMFRYGVKVDKDPVQTETFGLPLSMFGTTRHEDHRVRRKAANPLFNKQSIQRFEPVMRDRMQRMFEIVDGYVKRGDAVGVRDASVAVTMDSTALFLWGRNVSALAKEKFDPVWEAMVSGITESAPIARLHPGIVFYLSQIPVSILKVINPPFAAFINLEHVINHQVQRHRTQWQLDSDTSHTKQKDESDALTQEDVTHVERPVVRALLDGTLLPVQEKTEERLTQESVDVLVAAGETITMTLNTTIFHVLNSDPSSRLLDRLRKELSGVSTTFKWRELEQLPLFSSVAKEGLRIALTSLSRSTLAHRDGFQYKDHAIPPRTLVSMTIRDMSMDPKVFPRPDTFDPDRWLKASEEHRRVMEKNFVPFGRGPRWCIGSQFAYAELYHFLAGLFTRYDAKVFDTTYERDIKVVRDCVVGKPSPQSKGLFLKLTRRT